MLHQSDCQITTAFTMKRTQKILAAAAAILLPAVSFAQEVSQQWQGRDPHYEKIIPDKFFEIGLPLLFLYSLGHLIVSILKNRAENQLKIRMVDKGVSEETIVTLFKENNIINTLQPLKWGLFVLAIGVALIIIHINREYLRSQSGFLAVAIILIAMAIAFFIYYRILSLKSK